MLGAASVIVDEHGRILLVKHGYGELNWELPGGGGEANESAEETARREAREEVGLELHIDGLTGVYWEPEKDAHHFVFRARSDGEARVHDRSEITEIGWFDPSDLPRPLSDFTERRIADALSRAPVSVHLIGPRIWRR
jgi:ADP-ribose pyrophosphatase YjhB (NUDIX family)